MTARYASGEEPMVGDTIVIGGAPDRRFTVHHVMERAVKVADQTGAFLPEDCILIRRGESRLPEPTDYIFKEGDHDAGWSVGDDRPVLGLDRNGREVHKNQTVRDVHTGRTMVAVSSQGLRSDGEEPWFIQNLGQGMLCHNAELVTDEIAPPFIIQKSGTTSTTASGYLCACGAFHAKERGGRCPGCITDEKAEPVRGSHVCDICNIRVPGDVCETCVDAGAMAGEFERFARWLAAPTPADHYAEFRATVLRVLDTSYADLDVEAVTDYVDNEACSGGLLTLRIGARWIDMGVTPWRLTSAIGDCISVEVERVANELGRKALGK